MEGLGRDPATKQVMASGSRILKRGFSVSIWSCLLLPTLTLEGLKSLWGLRQLNETLIAGSYAIILLGCIYAL